MPANRALACLRASPCAGSACWLVLQVLGKGRVLVFRFMGTCKTNKKIGFESNPNAAFSKYRSGTRNGLSSGGAYCGSFAAAPTKLIGEFKVQMGDAVALLRVLVGAVVLVGARKRPKSDFGTSSKTCVIQGTLQNKKSFSVYLFPVCLVIWIVNQKLSDVDR